MPWENSVEFAITFEARWTNGFPGSREMKHLNKTYDNNIPTWNCLKYNEFRFVYTFIPKCVRPKAKYIVNPLAMLIIRLAILN